MEKLIISSENPKKIDDEIIKIKIYNADILMGKKEFSKAENQYLESLNLCQNSSNLEKHIRVRLAILYQLIIIESQEKNLSEMLRKLKNTLISIEKPPPYDEFKENVQPADFFEGFMQVMRKLMGMGTGMAELNNYKFEMGLQIKNKEILKDCEEFFGCLKKEGFSELERRIFGKIGGFLLFDLDCEFFEFDRYSVYKEKKPRQKKPVLE